MRIDLAEPVRVVAGIVSNKNGEFLLSSRPPGKPYAGYWEFAGGKVEAGECEFDALKREFWEELGIRIDAAVPWLAKVYVYEHATVHLRFFRIAAGQWSGKIEAREGQLWAWQKAGGFSVSPMLPANEALLRALALPSVLSGGLDVGFRDADGGFRVPPWALAEQPYGHVLLTQDEVRRLGRLPQAQGVWLIVSLLEEFWQSQDADVVVWRVSDDTAANEVLRVLRDGASMPIVVSASTSAAKRFGSEWSAHGAQAVVVEDVVKAV